MSVKIFANCNAIPSWFNNGALQFKIGSRDYRVEVNGIKKLSFDKQCNEFICKEVFAYLTNDTYGLVMRTNGTGTIFARSNNALVTNVFFDPITFADYRLCNGGALMYWKDKKYHIVDRFTNGESTIVSPDGIPLSLHFDAKTENLDYTIDAGSLGSGYPTLGLDKQDMSMYVAPIKSDGNFVECKKGIQLTGELSYSDGYLLL